MSHFLIPSSSESSQLFTADSGSHLSDLPEAPVGLETESYSEVRSPGSRPVAVEEDDVMKGLAGGGKVGWHQIPDIGFRQQVQARMSGVLGLEKGSCLQSCQFPETHTMTEVMNSWTWYNGKSQVHVHCQVPGKSHPIYSQQPHCAPFEQVTALAMGWSTEYTASKLHRGKSATGL